MTHELIAEEEGDDRQHLERLRKLLEATKGPVRIASAYVTESSLLSDFRTRNTQLLTFLSGEDAPWEIVSGSTSVKALSALIDAGVRCKYLSGNPRLHAKVYILGNETAVVTSANFTENGLTRNIEVGVQVSGSAVQELISWFKELWKKAREIEPERLSKWEDETAPLRREYGKLKRKVSGKTEGYQDHSTSNESAGALRKAFDKARDFFWCNTDRGATPGGNELEKRMHERGYAAAWMRFSYPGHMGQVKPGDLIFMYAKNKEGVIGIGKAKKEQNKPILQKLVDNDPDRIRKRSEGRHDEEWRIKVDWLAWDEGNPYYRENMVKPPLIYTFAHLDNRNKQHQELRDALKSHFSQK